MKVICAWCKKILKEGQEPVSHGVCPECKAKVEEEIKKWEEFK